MISHLLVFLIGAVGGGGGALLYTRTHTAKALAAAAKLQEAVNNIHGSG